MATQFRNTKIHENRKFNGRKVNKMDRTLPTYSLNAIANSEQKAERQTAQKIVQKGASLFSDVLGDGVKGPERFITKISSRTEGLLPPYPKLKDNALNSAGAREISYYRRDSAENLAQDNAIAKSQSEAQAQRQQNHQHNEYSQDQAENAHAEADRAFDRLSENIREQQLIQERLEEARRQNREQARASSVERSGRAGGRDKNYGSAQDAEAAERYLQQRDGKNGIEAGYREQSGALDKIHQDAQYNPQQQDAIAGATAKSTDAKETIGDKQAGDSKEVGKNSIAGRGDDEKNLRKVIEENVVDENTRKANALAANGNDNNGQLASLIREESIDVFDLQDASKNPSIARSDHAALAGNNAHAALAGNNANAALAGNNAHAALAGNNAHAALAGNNAVEQTASQKSSAPSKSEVEKLQPNLNAGELNSGANNLNVAQEVQSGANQDQQLAKNAEGIEKNGNAIASSLATTQVDTIDQQKASDVLKASQLAITRAAASSTISQVAAKEASLASGSTNTATNSITQSLAQNPATNLANGNLANSQGAGSSQAAVPASSLVPPTAAERAASAALANSNLPEVDIQTKVDVKAHNPEAVRLSGANAFGASSQARSNNNLVANPNNLAQGGSQGVTSGVTQVGNGGSQATTSTLNNNGLATLNSVPNANLEAGNQNNGANTRPQEARERLASQTHASEKSTQPNNRAKNILHYLASRLATGGGRSEAVNGNRAQGEFAQEAGARSSQASLESRFGQSFSGSTGSNSDASSGNAFSQSSTGSVAQRGGAGAASNFATASSFVREQVFVNIQRAIEGKVDSMTVKMRPEMLGRIEIRLDGDAAGRLQIVVLAERSETLDLLQRDARQLEQALQEAGIRTQDQGLQFGLQGQGKQDAQGDDAQATTSQVAQAGEEGNDGEGEAIADEDILPANIDKLQLRQDGRLNVQI